MILQWYGCAAFDGVQNSTSNYGDNDAGGTGYLAFRSASAARTGVLLEVSE